METSPEMTAEKRGKLPAASTIAEVLEQQETLTEINLSSLSIKDEEVERLADMIVQRCTIITHIDLSSTGITDEGAKKLAAALIKCPNIVYLNLAKNPIGAHGGIALAKVPWCCGKSTPGKRFLHFDLSHCPIGNTGVCWLADYLTWSTLEHIDLSYTEVGDEGTERLAFALPQCEKLRVLDLSHNRIEDKGAGKLAHVLPRCTNLIHLDLSHNSIGDDGAGRLAQVLKRCTSLAHFNMENNHSKAMRKA